MARRDTVRFEGSRPSEILSRTEQKREVELILPPSHPKQAELINAFDARIDPDNPGAGTIYNEQYPRFFELPKAYPDLRFIAGACGSKFGKAVDVQEPIPTPAGWRRMGDIREGDFVFDEHGKPVLVTYVTDWMYNHTVYRVRFSDGTHVNVDAGHLWVTKTEATRKSEARAEKCKKAQPLTTEQIRSTLFTASGKPNHSVDVCSPVQYPPAELPIQPYTLGCWLGDGTSSSGVITNIDEEVLERVRKDGFEVSHIHSQGIGWRVGGLTKSLRLFGLLGNKHVPAAYLTASEEQRLELLRGLMDTDGTVGKRGYCSFDNTNRQLADSVEELCNSLGIKTSRYEKQGKLNGVECAAVYRVHFTTDLPVFALPRKRERLLKTVSVRQRRRMIVAVEGIASTPVCCIRVDSPTHLFLVGKAFIPTHNTYGCSIRIAKEAWDNPGSLNWWVAPSYKQAEIAYRLVKRLLPRSMYEDYKADLRLELRDPDGNPHSTMEFKSADNDDNLRGFAVNFFVLDEAARISRAAYDSVMTTTTQTDGRGIIISTPKGRGWFYDEYQKGEKGHLLEGTPDDWPEWLSIRMPTWENPTVKTSRILTLRKNMPKDVFEQEIAARFLLESAGVFRGIISCIKKGLVDSRGNPLWEEPLSGHRYVMGVDLARKRDYSVIMVFDTVRKHMVYYDRFNALEWAVQKSRIVSVAKKYRAKVIMDGTGLGDPIVADVRNAGVSVEAFVISNRSKQELIEKLRVAIEFQHITFPMLPVMIRELERFEYKINSNGNISYSAPSGQHDDTVIALALANWGMSQTPMIYRARQVRGI